MESSDTSRAAEQQLPELMIPRFQEKIRQVESLYGFPTITVDADAVYDMIEYLYNLTPSGFQYLTTICGIHYEDSKQIAVVYQLRDLIAGRHIRIKTYLPEERPVIRSLVGVFDGANWMERETYDFYGVIFEGHPTLKRILNVEDMIIFPLRKYYPLEDQMREDKNDSMFGR